MPFTRPFKTRLDDGDLVYGIREKRTNLVMYLGTQHMVRTGGFPSRPMTVDQLDIDKSQGLPEPRRLWQQFHQDIREHGKYRMYTFVTKSGTVSDEALQTGGGFKEFTADSAIRRKCKFGLYWTIKNGFHIHFCLDGLNMAQIATKSFKTDTPFGRKPVGDEETRTKLRAVTGAELRWIYRHRNVPEVRERVQFWVGTAPVGPPWDEPDRQEIVGNRYVRWRDLWARYLPTREPMTLELETEDTETPPRMEPPVVLLPQPLPRCSECGAADEALLRAPNGALVCDPCRLAGLQEDEARREIAQGNPQPQNDPLSCSKCPKRRQSQSSWFWNRWHQCESCERVYCDTCGSALRADFLDAIGKSIRAQRFCDCGGETELIY